MKIINFIETAGGFKCKIDNTSIKPNNMIHFKGVGEHSVFELEKIILEQQEQLHQKQIEIQKMTDWVSVEIKLPQEQIVVIGKADKLKEPCACYYETSSSDFRLYPHGGFVKITHWRPIF